MSNWVEGRELFIGHCGDHDPGGLIISDSLRSNLLDMAGTAAKTLEVDVEEIEAMIDYIGIWRFGLNADFIDANNLTWLDNLETSSGRRLDDDRHPDHYKPRSRTTFAARRRVKPMRWWSRRRPVAGCVEIGSCSTLNRTPQGPDLPSLATEGYRDYFHTNLASVFSPPKKRGVLAEQMKVPYD